MIPKLFRTTQSIKLLILVKQDLSACSERDSHIRRLRLVCVQLISGKGAYSLSTTPNNEPRQVWMVEGGMFTHTQYRREEMQHENLQRMLQAPGFDMILLLIKLGFTL